MEKFYEIGFYVFACILAAQFITAFILITFVLFGDSPELASRYLVLDVAFFIISSPSFVICLFNKD